MERTVRQTDKPERLFRFRPPPNKRDPATAQPTNKPGQHSFTPEELEEAGLADLISQLYTLQ